MDGCAVQFLDESRAHALNHRDFPVLIYGTSTNKGSAEVDKALDLGYRAFDTATLTSHDEALDGNKLQKFLQQDLATREDIVIQSKFTPFVMYNIASICPYHATDELEVQVLKSFAHTMSNLKVDYLDVYLLHRPFENLKDSLRTWSMMEAISMKGGTRFLGLCQVDIWTLAEVFEHSRTRPVVVQNRQTKKNGFDVAVKRFCRERDLVYQAYGIMAEENRDLLELSCVVEHAASTGLSTSSALISLLVARERRQGLRFCVLEGSRSVDHMQDNLRATSKGSFPATNLVDDFDQALDLLSRTL